MRVLGVDPGLTRCGLGVVDGSPGGGRSRARRCDSGDRTQAATLSVTQDGGLRRLRRKGHLLASDARAPSEQGGQGGYGQERERGDSAQPNDGTRNRRPRGCNAAPSVPVRR